MSEFSCRPNATNNNSKKTNFFSHLLSDFSLFCSFIISHPLYFSYFIFFSPYIIKILSFLSPLFITTSLLFLALFTTFFRDTCCSASSEKSKLSFLLSTFHNAVESLRSNADDANGQSPNFEFEDLEAYKIVFDTIEIREDEVVSEENDQLSPSEAPVDKHMCHESLADQSGQLMIVEVKSLEGLLKDEDSDDFFDVSCEKEVKPLSGDDELKKVDEQKSELLMSSGSNSKGMSKVRLGADDDHLWNNDNDGEFYNSLKSFGSMRKEKEWRRTLACKLFEERHNNVEGSEGMDMLWETYEADSNKPQPLAKSKTKKGKKCSSKYEHDDEEIDDGQLCCLQALKFSAGKMNLGMGRPNLVKISKAFKGIGWLHNVTKHGKKIYH